ncbi:hypothetical protein COLSTE_00738 [Collinsella stercoris DSM 13279]|uniref:Uncharacterized protein n=1 Tax=Collinsella stercoris DSM 13279 TaxID=445975 RepID=B6G9J7_9ACTN|nr:hypothetical protein COLSTE_00738 [Collinsella stercoris DSM 13279]
MRAHDSATFVRGGFARTPIFRTVCTISIAFPVKHVYFCSGPAFAGPDFLPAIPSFPILLPQIGRKGNEQ